MNRRKVLQIKEEVISRQAELDKLFSGVDMLGENSTQLQAELKAYYMIKSVRYSDIIDKCNTLLK